MAGQGSKNPYAYLDQLSTKELEELLSADLDSQESDSTDMILYILEVIERRENKDHAAPLIDVDEAWAEFQTYYNIPEGKGRSLYPLGDDLPESQTEAPFKASHRPRRLRHLLAAAAVAACLIIFALPPALGYENFFKMIGQWSEEAFQFGPTASSTPKPQSSEEEFESLQAALDAYGVTEDIAPTWMPERFSQRNVNVLENEDLGRTDFSAFFMDGEDVIAISCAKHAEVQSDLVYEKDKNKVQEYNAGDITHYIFENNGQLVATWYAGSIECTIRGNVTQTELEEMINSIYEG